MDQFRFWHFELPTFCCLEWCHKYANNLETILIPHPQPSVRTASDFVRNQPTEKNWKTTARNLLFALKVIEKDLVFNRFFLSLDLKTVFKIWLPFLSVYNLWAYKTVYAYLKPSDVPMKYFNFYSLLHRNASIRINAQVLTSFFKYQVYLWLRGYFSKVFFVYLESRILQALHLFYCLHFWLQVILKWTEGQRGFLKQQW